MSILTSIKKITVGCWNINSLRIRQELLDTWMHTEKVDVILLQETKVQDQDFPRSFFDSRGYNVTFWGQKSYNGVAIASRYPITNMQTLECNGSHGQARYIQCMTGGLRVASIYVPNGKALDNAAYQDKLDFLDHVRCHVHKYIIDSMPTLLGADWNIAPSNADVWDTEKWTGRLLCSLPERQKWHGFLHDGWCDVVSPRIVGKNDPTWWDYRNQPCDLKKGLRIDAFLVSPWAMDRVYAYRSLCQWRLKDGPSDHAPIQMTITP
jgi:exodeoxyribonuclease-3